MQHVVVVGAGLAGSRAVQELRAQGHRGRITLVGAEPHLPYDRPPLSKGLLLAVTDDTTLDVPWSDLAVGLRLGVLATGLRPGVLETSAGEIEHDALVLATGARPVTLPGGVVLRTVDDARALRRRLVPGARLVVVGAGLVGAEVATAAATLGCRVTVVEASAAPLSGALGEQVGALTLPWYGRLGIEVVLRTAVVTVEPDRVLLSDGRHLPADVALVAVGARPDVGWLAGGPLELDRGVVVDAGLRAAPGVVAVGDCAAWPSALFGARLRVEHWDGALHAPAVAVTSLLGGSAVHDPVPYFWSDQLGHTLQHAGYAEGADHVVLRGDPAGDGGWTACWLSGDRLVAVLTVDRPRDLAQGRRLVARRAAPDPARLADPAVALKDA